MNDAVHHPKHYTKGKIECIKYIQDKDLNFALGNVVKYVTRAGEKDNNSRLQDLEKARQYLDFEIAEEKRRIRNENSTHRSGSPFEYDDDAPVQYVSDTSR